MRRFIQSFPLAVLFALVGLTFFTATAFAAGEALPADADAFSLLGPIVQAFSRGDYLYAGCIALVLACAVVRRYGWVKSERGIAALLFGGALGASLAGHAAAGTMSAGAVWSAAQIAIGAAGGFFALKHLVIDPLLKPLQAKLPAWAKPILNLVLWIFEKQTKSAGAAAVASAEKAGDVAVEAKPAEGVSSVLGQPVEVK